MSHLVDKEYTVTIDCGRTRCTFLVNARNPVQAVKQSFDEFVEKHREDLSEINFNVQIGNQTMTQKPETERQA